jgi:arylsulfatase A-like enzyme
VSALPRKRGTDKAGKPDIVLILADDDLEFSDLGCYGSEIATPNLVKQRGKEHFSS